MATPVIADGHRWRCVPSIAGATPTSVAAVAAVAG